jgi:hypothetical protein
MSAFRAAVIVMVSSIWMACGIKAPPLPPLADGAAVAPSAGERPVPASQPPPAGLDAPSVPDAGCCREVR